MLYRLPIVRKVMQGMLVVSLLSMINTSIYGTSEGSTGYTQEFIDLVQIVYGDGLLSQGGYQHIDDLFKAEDLDGKSLLDIGCGVGGVDIYLAQKHALAITAVDREPLMIQNAHDRLAKFETARFLKGSVAFSLLTEKQHLGGLPDAAYDIVFSKETILHVPVDEKVAFFKEILRVLKPGGRIIIYDWMHRSAQHTQELDDMIKADGIAYNLIMPQEYVTALEEAGFKDITFQDSSEHTIECFTNNIQAVEHNKDLIQERYGADTYKYALWSWQLNKTIFQNHELISGVFVASKP